RQRLPVCRLGLSALAGRSQEQAQIDLGAGQCRPMREATSSVGGHLGRDRSCILVHKTRLRYFPEFLQELSQGQALIESGLPEVRHRRKVLRQLLVEVDGPAIGIFSVSRLSKLDRKSVV